MTDDKLRPHNNPVCYLYYVFIIKLVDQVTGGDLSQVFSWIINCSKTRFHKFTDIVIIEPNYSNIGRYIDLVESGKPAYDFIETIDKDTSITEHIMLGLRSVGINYEDFRKKHNVDFESTYKSPISQLISNGYAVKDEKKISLTRKGYAVCDEIVATLF